MAFRLFLTDGLPSSLHEGAGLLKTEEKKELHTCGLSTGDPHPLHLNLLRLRLALASYVAGAPGQRKCRKPKLEGAPSPHRALPGRAPPFVSGESEAQSGDELNPEAGWSRA